MVSQLSPATNNSPYVGSNNDGGRVLTMLLTGFVLLGEHGGILKDGHGFWDPSLGRLSSAPGYDDLSRTLVINLRSYV